MAISVFIPTPQRYIFFHLSQNISCKKRIIENRPRFSRGELRAVEPQPHSFHIHGENEYFSRENGVVYRNGQVFRDIIDRVTGRCIESQLIRTNHAKVMYEIDDDSVKTC